MILIVEQKNLHEYVFTDPEMFHEMQLDDFCNELNQDRYLFDQSYISNTRKSLDNSVNNYGYKLIDVLKTNNLYILNGDNIGKLLYVEMQVR